MLRITAGIFRGRSIKAIDSQDLRPTTSFFREWLFNVLNNQTDLENAKILDLFAGSGVVGFEFLSRGAAEVIFVETAPKVIAQLKDNVRNLKIEEQTLICQQEVCSFLEQQSSWVQTDFIFMDPPYQIDIINRALTIIDKKHQNKNNLLIIIECAGDYQINLPPDWSVFKNKKTGTTVMNILKFNDR